MKLNKKAFTLTEILICIAIMMVMTVFAIVNIKPNDNKIRLYAYAGMNALNSALGTIYSENGSLSVADAPITTDSGTFDWLCTKMADYFALKSSINCSTTASMGDINFTLANGITIQGLANSWTIEGKTNSDGDKYIYKEFVFDIDSPSKGMNKVGIDRFPVRIYKNGLIEGTVIPSDCSAATVGTYCKNGSTKSGVNLAKANDTINYEIYRRDSKDSDKASAVASYKSYMEADCGIFGGVGYYTTAECAEAGYKLLLKCANETTCGACEDGRNICPLNGSTQLTSSTCITYAKNNNPENYGCIMMLGKPSTGAGIIIDAMADINAQNN